LTLKLATAPKAVTPTPPGTTGAATPPPETNVEPPPEEVPESHPRKKFIPWLTSTPGAMVGVGLTGVGLIGGGAFAFGSKSAYDAADSVAAQIADKAVNTDGKIDGKKGACNSPAVWLAQSTRWKNATQAEINDRASQYVENCNKYSDNVKSGDTFKKLAIVSFAVAGAAAVGTVIYYFADSGGSSDSARAASKRRVMVMPLYQPGFAGGFVTGTF